jgi:hypothetical protein
MARRKKSQQDNSVSSDNESVRHLRDSIAGGKHWFTALLESIALWTIPEETYKDRTYRYLIGGEAFDWLLLSERLLMEVDSLVPKAEVVELLFHSRLPLQMADEEFKGLIGESKYSAQLNYFYGVTVEEALVLAVEGEVRKEQLARGISEGDEVGDEVCRRLYGASRHALLVKFRKEKGYARGRSIQFQELKEFTYWLFKYRVNNSDKSRIASDTAKGLKELERQWKHRHKQRD